MSTHRTPRRARGQAAQDRRIQSGALVGSWSHRGDTSVAASSSPGVQIWSDNPTIIGATGGSGTRVLAEILARAGVFIGADLNRALDAMPFSVFFDVWINVFAARDVVFNTDEYGCLEGPMTLTLKEALAQHWADVDATDRPWGWKAGRSMYLLPFFHRQFPRMRFVHLVRDGRDIAFSSKQGQMIKHGSTYLSREERNDSQPVRSIALWSRANLAAAHYGEQYLGDRYLQIRFEDLCASPASTVGRLLDFAELEADAHELARFVQPPPSIGRWRKQDPRLVRRLHRFGREGLRAFDYSREAAPASPQNA